MEAMERIHKSFNEMPYGGNSHFARKSAEKLTIEDIACNLENLAETLDRVARQNDADAKELAEINEEMQAVKSLFARIL